METQSPTSDPAEASFDIVARQDRTEADVAALRSDVDEVKTRVDRIGRVASRPGLAATDDAAPEVKGFVDGYLRRGSTLEMKSISGSVPADGGYAVPRQIDAMIARQLTEISPIRAIAQVVQTGSAGYRKLVSTGGTASGWVSETAARPDPPAAPQAGQAWIVATPASGEWAGHEDAIVSWDGWQWTFAQPQEAMSIYSRATAGRVYYKGGWQSFNLPSSPMGGTVVDLEARAAIDAVVDLLATVGLAT